MNKSFQIAQLLPFITEIISKGGQFRFFPKGSSMLPTIREKRDSVFLENPDSLKVGDIVLYKRKSEKYVLHRIVGIKDGCYIMCGDNQIDYEYGIERDQIIAVAAAVFRDDRYYDRQSRQYYPSLYCRFLTLARRIKRRLKGQKMQ